MTVEQLKAVGVETDAESLVSRLLRDELSALTVAFREDLSDHALLSLDQRGMAQELIRDQYSGRYPFELLQNANDAASARLDDSDTQGLTVRFVITDTALLVADQGIGFGADEVRAICGLGRSSKDPTKSVGYKGLGFKSVGEICDKPQILAPHLMFGFDPDRVRAEVEAVAGAIPDDQRLPNFGFPFLLDRQAVADDAEFVDDLFGEGFRTVLRLPFRLDVPREKVVADVLATITPELLLFLPATGSLEVLGTSADFSAQAMREPKDDHDVVLLVVDDREEVWHVFSRRVSPPNQEMMHALGDTWAEVEAVHVQASVKLDDGGRPDHSTVYPLSVYFPTEERTGLPMILQADFALDLDRRFVSRTSEAHEYNSWLASELGRLVGEVVAPSMAASFPTDGRVVGVVSPRGSAVGFGAECVDQVVAHLATSRFVPCVDGHIRLPGEALLLPTTVKNAHQALRLMDVNAHGRLALPFVHMNPYARKLVTELLEVDVLSDSDALALLRPTGVEDLERLFGLLIDWSAAAGRKFPRLLSDIPFVWTRSGEWHSPSEGLFFPRKRDDPEIFDELPVEVAVIPKVDGAEDLLKTAGVRSFVWREIINDRVLPVLIAPESEEDERISADRLLRAYFQLEGGGDREVARRVGQVLVEAEHPAGRSRSLRPAGQTYFSEAWLGHGRLAEIYGPFREPEFLALAPPEDSVERDSEFEYLSWLGVDDAPRVFEARPEQHGAYLWQARTRHPHRRLDESIWTKWEATSDVQGAISCSQGHRDSQQLLVSYQLDRMAELMSRSSPRQLKALFTELGSKWGARYSPKMSAVFHCQHGHHSGPDRQRSVPSLLAFSLTQSNWVPVVEGEKVALVAPSQAWRLAPDIPRRVRAVVPALLSDLEAPFAAAIRTDLGIVDGGRPSSRDLMALLHRLRSRHESLETPDPDLFEAARWAIGHLNDALNRDATVPAGLEAVPLLATQDGVEVFVTSPYVCEDADLRDAWPDVPVLDAGRDLRRLRDALELQDLSELVRTVPEADAVDHELSEETLAHLRRAAPYLGAAAVEASPHRADTVLARLPRLEVVVCHKLALRYEWNDEVRARPEASSFLAVSLEGPLGNRRAFGTAYFEVKAGSNHVPWYAFGPQLAEFVDVSAQRDAFALILEADRDGRLQYLASRGVEEDRIEEIRQELARRLDSDGDFDDVLSGLEEWPEPDLDTDEADLEGEPITDEMEESSGTEGDSTGYDAPLGEEPNSGSDDLDLPEVDVSGVELEAAPGLEVPVPSRAGGGQHHGGSMRTGIDWARVTRMTRSVGRWGEDLVYRLERRRLEDLGFDSNAVEWRSAKDELSPFDIKSLDVDGHVIFIEVKTTTNVDPSTPFEISAPELVFAFRNRERHHIYRVVAAGTEDLRVIDFDDPAGRVIRGEGALKMSSARLFLVPPDGM
jgi:hypothetical protein